jgi:hypothetical protein
VSEGGIAGAEVVDRDAHAECLDRGEPAGGLLGVAHQGRLGDLDCQRAWIQPALGERGFHVGDERIDVELPSRDVDGHVDRIPSLAPRGALAAGLVQDPPSDLDDQARLLEQRDEVVGLHDAPCRAVPANQSLHSGGAHVPQIERGLVHEEELVLRERAAQVHLELHPRLDGVLHPGLEHHVAVSAVPLGPVHRDVRVAQHLLGRRALAHRDPDARGHGQAGVLVRELEGVLERFQQALGDHLGARRQ